MNAIEIRNLRKTYAGGFEALKGIDLTVRQGEFFGMLGPNGAGKSTTIGILSSLVNKTSGSVKIMGLDIDQEMATAKRFLGVVPQEFNFNMFETCRQIVVNQAGYYGMPAKYAKDRAELLFEQLGLWEKRDVKARELSGGMKRRLMIARALVHNPHILILDEPTAGVDISLRRSMWTFLEEANRAGLTIILTTHYLEEAESLCERIAIIDKGEIVENTATQALLQQLQSENFILYCQGLNGSAPDVAPLIDGVPVRRVDATTLEAELQRDQSITDLVDALAQQGIVVERMRNKANRLEELFVKLVEA
jgi:ABC-2 type transport system ATP-binding protein